MLAIKFEHPACDGEEIWRAQLFGNTAFIILISAIYDAMADINKQHPPWAEEYREMVGEAVKRKTEQVDCIESVDKLIEGMEGIQ